MNRLFVRLLGKVDLAQQVVHKCIVWCFIQARSAPGDGALWLAHNQEGFYLSSKHIHALGVNCQGPVKGLDCLGVFLL